jgi:hypothetical protein
VDRTGWSSCPVANVGVSGLQIMMTVREPAIYAVSSALCFSHSTRQKQVEFVLLSVLFFLCSDARTLFLNRTVVDRVLSSVSFMVAFHNHENNKIFDYEFVMYFGAEM